MRRSRCSGGRRTSLPAQRPDCVPRVSPCREPAYFARRLPSPLLYGRPVIPRALEIGRARRVELRLPGTQAGPDSPTPGRNALTEFLQVGLAILAHPLGFLGARLHPLLARGRKLGLVRLHAFRDSALPRLDVAAELLDVRRTRSLPSLLGAGAACNAGGEERDCHRDECVSDRHGTS